MPLFTAEIPETHLRINRPVIKQVVDDILLRFKDIPFREFRFLGDSSQLLTPGSATDAGAFNRSDADNYVNIEVTDEPDEEFGRSYVVTENQNKALISCKRTMMDMYPIYQNRKINIRLEVVCSSRVRLNGLITRIRQAMHQSETLFTHQISYDYDLPVPCAELLNQVYHLMEANHGYGIDFIELEEAGAAIAKPGGAISITDKGAKANDGADDTAAPAASTAAATESATTAEAEATTEAPGEAPAEAPAEEPVDNTPGIGVTAADGKFEFVVTNVETGLPSIGNDMFGTQAQGTFALVHVTVTNIGDKAQSFFGDNQTLVDTQGREHSADTTAAIYLENSESMYTEINPGNSVNAIVVFDIPADAVPATITLHDSMFSGGVTVSLIQS